MHITIGIKIFGIAVGLLILMAVVALLSMRMTRTVDGELAIIDRNYFPAYVALAQANIRTIEESAYARRLLLAAAGPSADPSKLDDLRQRIAKAGKALPTNNNGAPRGYLSIVAISVRLESEQQR